MDICCFGIVKLLKAGFLQVVSMDSFLGEGEKVMHVECA